MRWTISGVLFIDHLSRLKREMVLKLAKLRKGFRRRNRR
jgi:hypothetical protein